MEMPKFSGLVRLIAQIGAVIGCITGIVIFVGGLASFKIGLVFGLTAISGGLYVFFGSLAALGVVYCFLASVQAQIETRNALVEYVSLTKKQSRPAPAPAQPSTGDPRNSMT